MEIHAVHSDLYNAAFRLAYLGWSCTLACFTIIFFVKCIILICDIIIGTPDNKKAEEVEEVKKESNEVKEDMDVMDQAVMNILSAQVMDALKAMMLEEN